MAGPGNGLFAPPAQADAKQLVLFIGGLTRSCRVVSRDEQQQSNLRVPLTPRRRAAAASRTVMDVRVPTPVRAERSPERGGMRGEREGVGCSAEGRRNVPAICLRLKVVPLEGSVIPGG